MRLIEMNDADLADLYTLLELYQRTYTEETDSTEILLHSILDRIRIRHHGREVAARDLLGMAHNRRGAGRKLSYTEAQRTEVLELRRTGLSLRMVAAKAGMSYSTVQRICHTEKTW